MATNDQLLDEIARGRERNKSFREKAARKVEQTTELASSILGTGTGGALDARWATTKPLGINLPLIVGFLGLAVGISEMAGKASGPVAFYGAGNVGWELGKFALVKLSKKSGTAGVGAAAPRQLQDRQDITMEAMKARLREIAAA